MSQKNPHPSSKTDHEGHHYVPGQARGNASYFERPIPPVRDASTGHPIGSDGRIDWAAVIREVNQRDGHA